MFCTVPCTAAIRSHLRPFRVPRAESDCPNNFLGPNFELFLLWVGIGFLVCKLFFCCIVYGQICIEDIFLKLFDAFSSDFLSTISNYFKVLATIVFYQLFWGFSNYFATISAFLVKFHRKIEKIVKIFAKFFKRKFKKWRFFEKFPIFKPFLPNQLNFLIDGLKMPKFSLAPVGYRRSEMQQNKRQKIDYFLRKWSKHDHRKSRTVLFLHSKKPRMLLYK